MLCAAAYSFHAIAASSSVSKTPRNLAVVLAPPLKLALQGFFKGGFEFK